MSVGLIPPTNPAVGPGDQLLGVYVGSAAASIDCFFRNQGSYSGLLFQGDFDEYIFSFINLIPGTNTDDLWLRAATGATPTVDTGNNYTWSLTQWNQTGAGSAIGPGTVAAIKIANSLSTTATNVFTGKATVIAPLSTTAHKQFESRSSYTDSGGNLANCVVTGRYSSTTAMTAVQAKMSTGTITGTILVYGKAKSASTGNTNVLSGTVVQVVNTETGAVATGTTTIPIDDTIPQNTEGDQYMSLAITPKSATNKLKIEVVAVLAHSTAAANMTAALFQDATANALAAVSELTDTANAMSIRSFTHYMTAGTTSATTFKVRAGAAAGGTTTFNGSAAARYLGGVMASSITITEIAV